MLHPFIECIALEVSSVETRVELIGVCIVGERSNGALRWLSKAAKPRHHGRQAVLLDASWIAELIQLHPAMMEVGAVELRTVRRKRMEERVPRRAPIGKLNSQLERRLSLANEIYLVDAKHTVEAANRGQRGLPDANGANLAGFD